MVLWLAVRSTHEKLKLVEGDLRTGQQRGANPMDLGQPSPFFPGILLLLRKPSEAQGKLQVFGRNDGRKEWLESTPRRTSS